MELRHIRYFLAVEASLAFDIAVRSRSASVSIAVNWNAPP
jgi:hypothetical protein